jgi:hypothetical protein
MQLQKRIHQVKAMMYLDKNSPPPPRWMTLLASVYMGMLLFLAAHLVNLI